jgi:hypothetical protein
MTRISRMKLTAVLLILEIVFSHQGVRCYLRVLIGGDDFDFAGQQFEVIKIPPLSVAILVRHALKSFGFD